MTDASLFDLLAGQMTDAEAQWSLGTFGAIAEFSRDHGEPFEFTLGQREVIDGWDEGIKGMRVGGIRQLVIPASLGYGANGSGENIPPNAALKFEIEQPLK